MNFKVSLLICVTILFSACSKPGKPKIGNDESTPVVEAADTVQVTPAELPAPAIKVYIENSGSMDGYVEGVTEFENAVYSYLSDLQLSDLGAKGTETAKNQLDLYYINSKVIKQKSDIEEFIKNLEPYTFKVKGGNRGTTDLSDIVGTVLDATGKNEVSIFVSDCIFSPGKRYRKNDNADEYLMSQQIGITNHMAEKLNEDKDFGVVIMRLLSNFSGRYYNKFDVPTTINNQRPYYICLFGNKNYLKKIFDEIDVSKIKGSGVRNIFITYCENDNIDYSILPTAGTGKIKVDKNNPRTTITSAKPDNRGGQRSLKIAVGMDLSESLLPDEYVCDPANYAISNKAYSIEVQATPSHQYSHVAKLVLDNPKISKGRIDVTLMKRMPAWVEAYSDNDGLNIKADNAMEQTYGLKYFIGGFFDAYSHCGDFGSWSITIE